MKVSELVRYVGTEEFYLKAHEFAAAFSLSDNMEELLAEEPEYVRGQDVQMCHIACVVHKLANDHGVKAPDWVFKKRYYLDRSTYVYGITNKYFQEHLKKVSPVEFSTRNYFVTGNSI